MNTEIEISLTRAELDAIVEGLDAYYGRTEVIEIWERLCLIQSKLDREAKLTGETK